MSGTVPSTAHTLPIAHILKYPPPPPLSLYSVGSGELSHPTPCNNALVKNLYVTKGIKRVNLSHIQGRLSPEYSMYNLH